MRLFLYHTYIRYAIDFDIQVHYVFWGRNLQFTIHMLFGSVEWYDKLTKNVAE